MQTYRIHSGNQITGNHIRFFIFVFSAKDVAI